MPSRAVSVAVLFLACSLAGNVVRSQDTAGLFQITTLQESVTFCLPVHAPVSLTIDWGDASPPEDVTTRTMNCDGQSSLAGVHHTYSANGTYLVRFDRLDSGPWLGGIGNSFGSIYWSRANVASNFRLDRVISLGDLGMTSLAVAFAGCTTLGELPPVLPSTVTSLSATFYKTAGNYANVSQWNTFAVTDLTRLFYDSTFNEPLASWDTSNVVSMVEAFRNCPFNQPIGGWDTSKVTTMLSMFADNVAFNQPLANWNTASVTVMTQMFGGAASFNQPIGTWDVSKVTGFERMLGSASAFNQPLDSWNTRSATTFQFMFSSASSFNQPLNSWNTTKATSMFSMFYSATSFNQPLSNWNVRGVSQSSMAYMFYSASSFSQNISSWCVSHISSQPSNFAALSPLENDATVQPVWGATCPSTPIFHHCVF